MTKKPASWISRRGQDGAATAVELVLERQPLEPLQQIDDELIEDSPYQARQPISDASLEELIQGIRTVGFQGVLIVRPHSDAVKRRQGYVQLVYGHRRRAAWRFVCKERGEQCLIPTVVREVSDSQMLMIGAQENLQRQDLDPVEEAQIVAWLERMFFEKNQAEIGAMLGKSSDWVSIRSRIHRLPEPLKERLRQRPRAITHMLELTSLYTHDSTAAISYAARIVGEHLSLETVRALIREYSQSTLHNMSHCEELNNPRNIATTVQSITKEPEPERAAEEPKEAADLFIKSSSQRSFGAAASDELSDPDPNLLSNEEFDEPQIAFSEEEFSTQAPNAAFHVLARFQELVAAIEKVASNAENLPNHPTTVQVLTRAEHSLRIIRHTISRNWVKQHK